MLPVAPSIAVIVPTLNEAENIEGIIGRILAGGASLEMEIIVVDDGSRDETQAIVRRLSETHPVTLLARDKPKDGLAGAVLAGARAATAGAVLVIDADGSHPPEKIPDLALPVIRGERDMVIGSRYAPGGSTPGWSRKRRLMSRAASACAWPLTDVHDALSGFFAVRRELLAKIPPDAAGFKIALEILVRGGDALRVAEVPISFRDRELGQSKMGPGVILTYFRRLLALSGWRESHESIGLAMAKTGLVWAVDFAVFLGMAGCLRAGLGPANLLGFASGAVLNAWLKTAQLPLVKRRSAALLSRLLFVSLLALFLRSGVLWTCAQAFDWPWIAAIVPAIVTSWVVLFLGYALFIWPVREQYGSGVRWRVAAMGASAYLLALRVAYLYAMPIDRRLAAMPDQSTLPIGDRLTVGLRELGTTLLGSQSAGFNLPALLCWGAAAWAVFNGARKVFDKTTAFRTLLLFSVLPVFFWTGTVFGPATVLMAGWAVLLWLMTFTRRWQRRFAMIACATSTAFFWWPGGWLPCFFMRGNLSPSAKGLLFFPMQVVFATPAALVATWRYFARWPADARRTPCAVAAICAIVAGIATFAGFTSGTLSSFASGAIWLPLLPFIAADMQKPGKGRGGWWGAVIYACIVIYGLYFYWLAYLAHG